MNLLETAVPATGLFSVAWLLIAIPLLSAGILLVTGRTSDRWGHWLGVAAPLASFVIGLVMFIQMLSDDALTAVSVPVYEWFSTGDWTINVGLLIDHLSILFVLLITGVGSLIHIYSLGYMAEDPDRRRFFAYLNLFIAAMLLLVLADNYLVLFFGWEGVGLASYLLVGFWHERPAAAAAGNKAFIVNRVGDLGMIIALFTMFGLFGSTAFVDVDAGAPSMTPFWATLLGLLLLVGACAKSAQFPLQSWLMDAMEGPTPVSALIHAATMVTAGVYLIVRSGAIYYTTPTATLVVAIVGTVTMLAGAWIGSFKDDIKRALAGSTMSQIGYMILAAGIGPAGVAFAIFHLLMHGVFKANLFLGSGSIMHAMNGRTDMRRFGGLAKVMKITTITFAASYLAIIGFPFTDAFYSKGHIIDAAFAQDPIIGILAIVGAGITAYYMTRIMMMTFVGEKRWHDDDHPHEAPPVMTVPLIILGLGSLFLGLIVNNWIQEWLHPAIGNEVHPTSLVAFPATEMWTVAAMVLGAVVAWWLFRKNIALVEPATKNPLALAGRATLYQDAFNEYAVVRPTVGLAEGVDWFDKKAVDGVAEGSGSVAGGLSAFLRLAQNGYVRTYGLTLVVGVVAAAFVVLIRQWV